MTSVQRLSKSVTFRGRDLQTTTGRLLRLVFMLFPDTYRSGELIKSSDLSFWGKDDEGQRSEEKQKVDQSWAVWHRCVRHLQEKHLKKWHCMAVLLEFWLSRNLNMARSVHFMLCTKPTTVLCVGRQILRWNNYLPTVTSWSFLSGSSRAGRWAGAGCRELRVLSPPAQPPGSTNGEVVQAKVGGPGLATALRGKKSLRPSGEVMAVGGRGAQTRMGLRARAEMSISLKLGRWPLQHFISLVHTDHPSTYQDGYMVAFLSTRLEWGVNDQPLGCCN